MTIRIKKWTQMHKNINMCQARYILDKTKDKYIQLLFIYVRCDAWMTNTFMKIFSGSRPCHNWDTKRWFRDPPIPSSGSMCTVTENQRYVSQSVSQCDESSFFWCAEWQGWRMQCNTSHSHHRHCFVLLTLGIHSPIADKHSSVIAYCDHTEEY